MPRKTYPFMPTREQWDAAQKRIAELELLAQDALHQLIALYARYGAEAVDYDALLTLRNALGLDYPTDADLRGPAYGCGFTPFPTDGDSP